MVSRLDKHNYESEVANSRVARNQELYNKLYNDESYLNDSQPSLERTTEIDIEKVRELLRGRETYRKEMKMREYNILKNEMPVEKEEVEPEEKNYDINEYLHKASHEREYQPYHKINVEPVVEEKAEDEDIDEDESVLEQMGNTELSLNMFGDLSDSGDLDDTDAIEEITKALKLEQEIEDEEIEESEEDDFEENEDSEETEDDDDDEEFFTGSIKIHLSDNEDDDEEERGTSLLVKIIMIALVVIIIALVAILLFL